jgi:hypothetical protein
MAITLSKSNIVNGNTIQAADVSQSIDAFTGTIAYDITLSGSLQLTGSVKSRNGYTGSLQGTASIATSASYALTATTATTATSASYAVSSSSTVSSSYAVTASFALNGGGASYPLSTYINNATYGTVGTAYPIDATSKGMLYIDTDGNTREVYFEFNAGVSDQIITFTTYWDQSSSNLTPSSIYLKAASSNIYGLKSNLISGTTSRLSDLLSTSSPAITLVYSFQFQYTTVNSITGWFLINVSAG